jgi:hypothetical protein
MERQEESLSQMVTVEAEAAAEDSRPTRWQPGVDGSDGEALAVHEI